MKWISVEERLPDMTPIYRDGPRSSGLVITFNRYYVSVGKLEETFAKRKARWIDRFDRSAVVTHWMPLPDPPEGQ